MADNLNTTFGIVATRDDSGVHTQRVLIRVETAGGGGAHHGLTGTLANGLLVDVSRIGGTVTVTGPLTDAQLRAVALAVSGPLTDAQLRATPVPVSKPRVPLTGSAPTFATVGTASAVALALNAARKGLILINTSANWIYLAFGVAAVVGSGIALSPNGGSYTMGEFDFTTQEVRAVASGAASNLAIQEFV